MIDELESLRQQLAASEAREKNYREEVVKLSYDLANAYSEREAAFQCQADLKEQLAKEWQLHDDTKRQLAESENLRVGVEFGMDCADAEAVRLRQQLAAKDEEIERLRTGDTCARACEGMAYRIEARNLKQQLAAKDATINRLNQEKLDLLTEIAKKELK